MREHGSGAHLQETLYLIALVTGTHELQQVTMFSFPM